MIDDSCAYFIPVGEVLYIGDADAKLVHFDEENLATLGVRMDTRGKLPDLVVYQSDRNWLFLMEAASSHGPVDAIVVSQSRRRHLQSDGQILGQTLHMEVKRFRVHARKPATTPTLRPAPGRLSQDLQAVQNPY